MSKQREVYYSPNIIDEKGVVTNEPAEYYKLGWLEYWGQSTAVSYSPIPNGEGYIPIIQHVVVAVVQDQETGKVHICNAEQIKFKV